jgi:hypothetical protein
MAQSSGKTGRKQVLFRPGVQSYADRLKIQRNGMFSLGKAVQNTADSSTIHLLFLTVALKKEIERLRRLLEKKK